MRGKYNGMKHARDWLGQPVMLAREIGTGAARYPAGLRGRIVGQGPNGLEFEADTCACCGVRPRITHLGYFDVEIAFAKACQSDLTNVVASVHDEEPS